MRRWLSIVLVAAIAVTACTPIDPAEHEWCHIYDLGDPMLGLFIDHGGQDTVGIYGEWQPEYSNYLYQFEIIEPFIVYPDALEVIIERGYNAGTSPAITINEVVGTAFGHDISLLGEGGIAPGWPGAVLPLQIDFNEASPVGDDRITVSFTTYPGELYITQIAVYGRGVSPYGYTECGNAAATNTPVDHMPTETGIPTATNTPVPTITNTPTMTHTPYPYAWCYAVDFTLTNGFVQRSPSGGVYSPGVGWIRSVFPGAPDNILFYSPTSSAASDTVVYYLEIRLSSTPVLFGQMYLLGGTGSPVPIQWSQPFPNSLTGIFTFSPGQAITSGVVGAGFDPLEGSVHPSWNGAVTYVKWQGSGTNPFGVDNCSPVPTATPTNSPTYTPSNTNTPSPLTNTPTQTLTPSGTIPSRTPVPTMTRTFTPSPLPPVHSPTPFTPLPTWTMENTLPVPTAPPTRTLIPLATGLGTATMEATYPVPGFGTGVGPDITAAATAVGLGTLEPVDGHSDIYNLLGTAVAELNELPGDMTSYVPDPDISPMLGYAKWMLSCTSLYEILGENAGTMACHATVGILLVVVMAVVYNGLRIIMLVMKFAVWIFMKIRDLIPLI